MSIQNLNTIKNSNEIYKENKLNDLFDNKRRKLTVYKEENRPERLRAFSCVIDQKSNLFKIIIHYNFIHKKYILDIENYDFYENKDYLIAKIDEFNQNKFFNMSHRYHFSYFIMLLLSIPNLLLSLLLFYIFFFFISAVFFNLGVFLIFIGIIILVNFTLEKKKFLWAEKIKRKKIKEILDYENNDTNCKKFGIKWEISENGYWLEVVKN